MKLKKNLKFDRNLHFKESHISSDSRFFYIKFWITSIKKLVSNILLTYLRPVNCFDLNFVFGTSWWKCPTPGISSLSIWLFFFHPNRHSVPEKAKKSRKNLTTSMASMATMALGKILLSWPFFLPTLQQLGLLIFTFVQVCCVRSRAQQSWRKWWFVVM